MDLPATATRIAGPVSGRPEAIESWFKSKMAFLTVSRAEIYYEVHGQGPGIIFAHGLGGNHMTWWQQVPFFSERYTCVTFAARGFYPSSGDAEPARNADDLAALIEHLGLERVTLVAQSMGGWACSSYTLHHPEKVRGLVMASTLGVLKSPDLDPGGAERVAVLFGRGVHPAAGERMAREQPALHHLYRLIDGLSLGTDKRALIPRLMAERNIEPTLLAGSVVPLFFIVGREDWNDAQLEWLRAQFRGRRIEVIPDTGHSVYFERPDKFNALVAEFVGTLPI